MGSSGSPELLKKVVAILRTQTNLEQFSRLGVGYRIALHSVSKKRLLKVIATVHISPYIQRAKKLQHKVQQVNGLDNIIKAMKRFLIVSRK